MTGLVLQGGAMRAMFTAGVLDVMMEQGMRFDSIVGVSAGALFGVNYLSGQKGRVIRYNKRFNHDPRYMGLLPLLKEGNIVSTQYAYEQVPHELDPFDDDTYMASPVPYHAVVTNVDTGLPEYIRVRSVFQQMDVLRASGSMPFVSKPVAIDGQRYLDGGISDSIPWMWAAAQGCDRLVVVLTRDAAYRKSPMNPSLLKLQAIKYPRIAELLADRHARYNECISLLGEQERQGNVFVIRPSEPITISQLQKKPEKLQSVYDLGVRAAKASLPRLHEFLT